MERMLFNRKKMFRYFVLLFVGLVLIVNGMIGYYFNTAKYRSTMTDEEVIERAKALGYVELTEQLEDASNE